MCLFFRITLDVFCFLLFYISCVIVSIFFFFFFQAEDGIRDRTVTGVQTCALPIFGDQARPISDVQRAAIASQLLILVMFMFSFVLAFSAVFAAAPAISADVESGIKIGRASCRERV